MTDFRMIATNGSRIRAVVQGNGPLVIMVHGFPESWYSWRHQIAPIAAAGFTACAIDVRGYGGSAKPPKVEDYSMENIIGDVVGIADALGGGEKAILVGHDWGAPIVWNSALVRPDKFKAVAALSVVYSGVPARPPSEIFDEMFTKKNLFFYQNYFQEVGRAERDFDIDPTDFLRTFYYLGSGEFDFSKYPANKTADADLLTGLPRPEKFGDWLTDADVAYYVEEFTRGGFFGPLSRYRNHDRDFHYLSAFRERKIEQPAFFIAGDRDGAYNMFGGPDPIPIMRQFVPNLQGAHVLPGCGHWTQQERPNEVNALLVPWLRDQR